MAGMAPSTRRKHLRELRRFIDDTDDFIEKRIAYEMETAIRRVTEDVVQWPSLVEQAKGAAAMLRNEIHQDRLEENYEA